MWILRSDWSHFNGELVFTLIWGGGGGSFSKDSEQYHLTNACLLWWLHARDSRGWEFLWNEAMFLPRQFFFSPPRLPTLSPPRHLSDVVINAVAANKKPSRKAWFVIITCDRIFLSFHPSHAISEGRTSCQRRLRLQPSKSDHTCSLIGGDCSSQMDNIGISSSFRYTSFAASQ